MHFLWWYSSAKMQISLSCMILASGASKQVMNVLHHACLTMSYISTSKIINVLADSSIEREKIAASHPHALTYDNINISSQSSLNKARIWWVKFSLEHLQSFTNFLMLVLKTCRLNQWYKICRTPHPLHFQIADHQLCPSACMQNTVPLILAKY